MVRRECCIRWISLIEGWRRYMCFDPNGRRVVAALSHEQVVALPGRVHLRGAGAWAAGPPNQRICPQIPQTRP